MSAHTLLIPGSMQVYLVIANSPNILCDIISCMNNSNGLRIEAIKLRKLGNSYKEISQILNIPKSTLSYWLKNIKLEQKYLNRLYTKQINILSKGPKSLKERRAREVNDLIIQANNSVDIPLNDQAYKFFGVGLYWAEGSKSKLMQITNSDPYFILFMVRWFEKIFGIKPNELKGYLNLYPQQEESKIKMFWSNLTGIPINNFGKTFIKPVSKNYKKNNLYFGTLRIYVPRSTNLKYEMLGWLQAILQDYDSDIELVNKKWSILRKTKKAVNL
jgi:hypothetical protein